MLKKILTIPFLLFIVVLLCSCEIKKTDVMGVYVAENLINNIDTLKVLENGTYSKVLYRKSDNSLVYKNIGKWDFKDGRIILDDFFLDEDQVYSKEAGDFKNVLITSYLPVSRKLNKIVIHYMQLTDYKYYEKQ
jgi:hypothetical protein